MSAVQLTFKHGRSLPEARTLLDQTVHEVHGRFGAMIQRTEWAADRNSVKLAGPGFEVDMRVDASEVHIIGDIPFLGALLGGPLLQGLKQITQQTFQKRLPGDAARPRDGNP